MSSYRSGGPPPGRPYTTRPMPVQARNDFYDEQGSRSRSRERRYSSPYRRQSPPHAAEGRCSNINSDKNWDRRRDSSFDRDAPLRDRFSPSPRRGRNAYRDRDREDYRSSSYDSHSRSRSRSRSHRNDRNSGKGEPPSKEIILEGLAAHLTEDDSLDWSHFIRQYAEMLWSIFGQAVIQISLELKQYYRVEGLEDVRVIRDRQTRQSRQFGFLRFATLSQARSFMERNHPLLYLYGESSSTGNDEAAKVRIAYTREKHDHSSEKPEGEWICKVCNMNNYATRLRCFKCQAFRADADAGSARSAKTANVGDNDASPDDTPSQFLLLRGLEPSVSEELLAKGVAKLYKAPGVPSQPRQAAGKKVAKVASTTGDSNLGAKEGSLRRILLVRDRKTNDSWRYGFAEFAAVEDAQAALTRYNSFDKFTIASKPVMASYVHAGVFVPALNPTPGAEKFTFSPMANPALKLKYWDEEAYVTELVVSTAEAAAKEETSAVKVAAMAAESESIRSIKENDKSKKRKAETPAATSTSTKKAAPSQLQFWSNRHAELHGMKQTGSENNEGGSPAQESPGGSERPDATRAQSYADPNRKCCYLCSRQFQTLAEVNRHERLSKLHRQNLDSEAMVAKATRKLEKHDVQPQETNAEYRDRAKERRKAFGVVNKKGEVVQSASKASKPALDVEETTASNSKGAALLQRMGYTAGQGLGASGSGMMAPINQDVYVAGVGLGAQGGKLGDAVTEAARNTKGDYSGFAEKTREGARERYGRM